jgi:hypothetical protein
VLYQALRDCLRSASVKIDNPSAPFHSCWSYYLGNGRLLSARNAEGLGLDRSSHPNIIFNDVL